MKPTKTKSTNVTFELKGGTRENDLPIYKHTQGSHKLLTSYWKPTEQELAYLAEGGVVALTVWGDSHPPVNMAALPIDSPEAEVEIPQGAEPVGIEKPDPDPSSNGG